MAQKFIRHVLFVLQAEKAVAIHPRAKARGFLVKCLIIISFYFDRIKNEKFWRILHGKMINFKVFGKEINVHSTYLISGIILIIMGILIFNDYLYRLNQLALQSTYVQEIIISGEEFLKNLFV